MAKENNFVFSSATVDQKEGIQAGFDLQSAEWEAKQDITQYKEHAKNERDRQDYFGLTKGGYRKMATIPDIVAIEILQKYKLDLHDPMFMSNPANLTKLKKILITEYRDLVINT
jgi:hypothetical protein